MAALAAANFFWQLGSSSIFIDEGLSWGATFGTFGQVMDGVRGTEISPPLHYFGLWAWTGAFGDAEWVMRLPSAAAGVVLVFVVFRLGQLVFDERAGLLAAALTAVSPLPLMYAQQARAYVFAMLLAAAAIVAALEADRSASQDGRTAWLVASGAAAIVGFWTHYTVGLVTAPLLVWMWARSSLGTRARTTYTACVVAGWAVVLPLFEDQVSKGHQEGIAGVAQLTTENLLKALERPLTGGRTA